MSKFFRPWMALGVLFSLHALPSYAQWGSGMYPAMPSCGYEMKVGDEASDIRDELKERQQELKDAKSDLSKVKSRLSSIKTSVNSQRDLFKLTGFDGAAFNFIERHINSGTSCRDYKGSCEFYAGTAGEMEQYPYWYFALMLNERMRGNSEAYIGPEMMATPAETFAANGYSPAAPETTKTQPSVARNSRMPAADAPAAVPEPERDERVTPGADTPVELPKPEDLTPRPEPPPRVERQPEYPREQPAQCRDKGVGYDGGFTAGTFLPHCGPNRGEVKSSICGISDGIESIPRGRNAASCEKYLQAWQEKKKEEEELKAEKLRLEAVVKELEALTKVKKAELRDSIKEFQREQRESMTEGGCLDCIVGGAAVYQPRKPTIWETVGNFALAGLSIYGGMQSSKYIADQNARLGFQSTPMPLMGATMTYGWPFIQAGLQGVLPGAMGQGSFGCAGTGFNGGQAMGPYGMAGPYGMMNPYGQMGFSPGSMWGMPNNMYGSPYGNGMFMPGAGPGFMPGFGQQNYCPVWPCPMGMMGMNGMNGMNPMMNGMMGMNPMMMGMNPNMMGMMNPMGGFNPMMPGYLNPGFSMGMNPMMNGMNPMMMGGMNPMMMGGMNPMMMNGQYNPYGMMNPMMNGMNPMGGMMGGMDPMMNYQMQQMQQQMAMQQYNMQMQMQMRNYQNQMSRQQALQGLYSEMNNLMMRIQSTQMQMGSNGMLGFDNSFMPASTIPGAGSPVVIPGQVGTPYSPQTPYTLPYQTTPTTGVPSYR